MHRKRVTQGMRRDRLGEASASMRFLACVFDRLSADRVTWKAAREQPFLWMRGAPIAAQDVEQLRRQHDVTILAAFALLDANHHSSAVDSCRLEANGFRDTQS